MGLTYIKNHYGPTPVEFVKVVEEMKKNHKYSYVILSSFNDFISEYRKEGLNAYTIAHYIYHNKEIKEKIKQIKT